MKTVLITGSNGLLGQELVALYSKRKNIRLVATARDHNRLPIGDYEFKSMDITSEEDVSSVLSEVKPDVVINTAAMTNVDACESHKEECWEINVHGVERILNSLGPGKLIQVSTDFVFDGTSGPYSETDEPNPLSYYAKSKLAAEELTCAASRDNAIARTIIVYGKGVELSRSNIVLWAIDELKKGNQLNIVNDQFRSPTWAPDLAMGCALIEEKDASGIFNIAGPETFSMYEMVVRIARFLDVDESLVVSVNTDALNRPAPRPMRTGLVIDKARNLLGYSPHTLEESLQSILD